ncbi:MAG TPA: hypothetical protein VFQ20_08325 [Burkholderiaceae bacterium]|nr:hypothetical protein [Burkholderiaceae bacterium]
MTIFYGVMGSMIVLTLLPSLMFILLYACTGEEACARRARLLFDMGKVFALAAFNVGVWGNVAVAVWSLVR